MRDLLDWLLACERSRWQDVRQKRLLAAAMTLADVHAIAWNDQVILLRGEDTITRQPLCLLPGKVLLNRAEVHRIAASQTRQNILSDQDVDCMAYENAAEDVLDEEFAKTFVRVFGAGGTEP